MKKQIKEEKIWNKITFSSFVSTVKPIVVIVSACNPSYRVRFILWLIKALRVGKNMGMPSVKMVNKD